MERDSKGRFVKGHKFIEGGEKGWFEKGIKHCNKDTKGVMKAWNKGKSMEHSGSFKKGHKGYKAQLGKKHPDELKKRMSDIKKRMYNEGKIENTFKFGSEHPNWQGGTSFEPYTLDFNDKFKEMIRERDNHYCINCNKHQSESKKILSIHHIDYDKKNIETTNLISLCTSCHAKTNFDRECWEDYFIHLMGFKVQEGWVEI